MEFKTCEQYVLAQLEQLESENAKMREEMNRVEQLYAYINELKYQNENLQGQIAYLRSILDKKAEEESAGAEECCGSCAGDCDGDCAG